MNSRIYINNFISPAQTLKLSNKNKNKKIELIAGFELQRPDTLIRNQVVTDIINSLITHDTIVIRIKRLPLLVFAFGLEDTIELINSGAVELIEDIGMTFTILKGKKENQLITIFDATEEQAEQHTTGMEWLESYLKKKPLNSLLVDKLLINSNNNIKNINYEDIKENSFLELDYDLNNNNLCESLKIESKSRTKIRNSDIYKVLRLNDINTGLIYSHKLECENTLLDGAIKTILPNKLSPVFQKENYDPNQIFEDISQIKGIPSLGEVYLRNEVSISDILNIRQNFNGKKFRLWLKEVNYDQTEISKQLMSSNLGFNINLSRRLRFVATNAIGFVNPVASIATSFVDSFIIDKILNGWHPNFFLDNTLKNLIDKKILEHSQNQKKAFIKKRAPKTGRNDPCPCGSTKKFKKCCGV